MGGAPTPGPIRGWARRGRIPTRRVHQVATRRVERGQGQIRRGAVIISCSRSGTAPTRLAAVRATPALPEGSRRLPCPDESRLTQLPHGIPRTGARAPCAHVLCLCSNNAQQAQPWRTRGRVTGSDKKGLGLIVDASTSVRLGSVRQHGTTPELAVRAAARSAALGYRVKNRDLPGSPDLANRRARWVIFVHGCFWHRHPRCVRTTTPRRNRAFWQSKFRTNVARDRRVVRELEVMGYRVLTVWECQTERPRELRRVMVAFAKSVQRRTQRIGAQRSRRPQQKPPRS